MSIKGNLQASLADQKSRIFLFLMLSIIVIVSLVAYFSRNSRTSDQNTGSNVTSRSAVINPSAALDPIPGLKTTSPEYQALQDKNYKAITTEALKQEGTPIAALPTLQPGNSNLSAIPGLVDNSATPNINRTLQQQNDMQEKMLKAQQDRLEQQQLEAMNKKAQELMGRQTQVLAQNWQVTPQQYVAGANIIYAKQPNNYFNDKGDDSKKDTKPKIFYKAGDILFGVTLTSVNSDEPGPILARIVSGPLSNAKIIGTINPTSIPQTALAPKVSQSLILEFNLLNIPGKKSSVSIQAVAIDPNTARTGLATSVNHHYLMRYGTFFAANFLSGIGQAVAMQNQSQIITTAGTAAVGSNKPFTGKDETKIALGKTAEAVAKSMDFLATPPTITIAAGTPIGLLLQSDIIISGDNTGDIINRTYNANYPQQATVPMIPATTNNNQSTTDNKSAFSSSPSAFAGPNGAYYAAAPSSAYVNNNGGVAVITK